MLVYCIFNISVHVLVELSEILLSLQLMEYIDVCIDVCSQ